MNFFFDNNISPNIARALALLNDDCSICHLQDKYAPNTTDEEWLRDIGNQGFILITRDKKITKRKAELSAYKIHKIGAFILTGKNLRIWDLVKQLVLAWERIKELSERTQRPFAFSVRPKGKIESINL